MRVRLLLQLGAEDFEPVEEHVPRWTIQAILAARAGRRAGAEGVQPPDGYTTRRCFYVCALKPAVY